MTPKIVSPAEWEEAHQRILAKEKAAMRAADALAAERRRAPRMRLEKKYVFETPNGEASLLDLFEGRRQLVVYHFMFGPTHPGWPEAGCVGCSMFADQVAPLAHLHARDTSFTLVSPAPLANLLRYRARMGWDLPWVSSAGTTFDADLGVGKGFGLNVLLRDGETVYRTYFTSGRGVEVLGTAWSFLDRTPLGRQEEWEDSPPGAPKGPAYVWWRRHDEYDAP